MKEMNVAKKQTQQVQSVCDGAPIINPRIEWIGIDHIVPSATNPRKIFKAIDELAESIRSKGVLQPIVIRPVRGDAGSFAKGPAYELVCGEQRWRACKMASAASIPAIIRTLSDSDVLEIQVIENDQRDDVHPLDQADGYRALIDKGGYDVAKLAAKIGRPEAYVRQRLQLTHLVKLARDWFAKDKIQIGHAMLIARLNEKQQESLLKDNFFAYLAGSWGDDRIGSVESLKETIEELFHLNLKSATFPKDDPELVAAAGPCTTCVKRTGNDASLWPDVAKEDTCTDPVCFKAKERAFVQLQVKKAEAKAPDVIRVSVAKYRAGKGVLGTDAYEIVTPKDAKKLKTAEREKLKTAVVIDHVSYGKYAGRKPGQVVQIRVKSTASSGSSNGAHDYRKEQEKRDREEKIGKAARGAIAAQLLEKIKGATPADVIPVVLRSLRHNRLEALKSLYGWKSVSPKSLEGELRKMSIEDLNLLQIRAFILDITDYAYPPLSIEPEVADFAKRHGVDCKRAIEDAKAAAKSATPPPAKKGKKSERTCRVCGCTENDCAQCIEKTGEPCTWVAEDLCSACVGEQEPQPELEEAAA
jgi:ParB family chromosome partitioning protein